MRWLLLTLAFAGACGTVQAREPLAAPMARTPSIMVEDRPAPKAKAANRERSVQPRANANRRAPAARPRLLAASRPSTIYETETRSLNSSIGRQLQDSQAQQSRQVDTNLFRQEIQRSTGSFLLGCTPGSLGC